MVAIQDDWQHVYVVGWPKLSGVQFLLQLSIFGMREMVAVLGFLVIAALADNMLMLQIDANLVVFDFYCKFLSLIWEKW